MHPPIQLVLRNTAEIVKVYIIKVQDCLRMYTFIISDPLTRFIKWKFPNFGREKGVPPLQQDFHQDFRFFSLKIQVLEFWQYWKLEKIWFYPKNGKKTQTIYSKSLKGISFSFLTGNIGNFNEITPWNSTNKIFQTIFDIN